MRATILHFSDTHEPAALEQWRALLDKRLFGVLNSTFVRRSRRSRSLLSAAVDHMLKNPPDLALFTGDATSCGQSGEFSRALQLFQPLLDSAIPFVYVPGNHDAYVRDASCVAALKQFTLAMSRGSHPLDSYPFMLDFPLFRLAVIHCARPFNPVLSCGRMSPETRQFLLAAAARPHTRPLLCAGHFPLLIHASLLHPRRRLYGGAAAADLLKRRRIDLSLCGHIHRPCERLDASGRGEIVAGSLTAAGTIAQITYDSDTNQFTLRRIALGR